MKTISQHEDGDGTVSMAPTHAVASPVVPGAIETAAVDEVLRTFAGEEGVLGALGVYRAGFKTMEQTAPLMSRKVQVHVLALGGQQAQGEHVKAMVELVAEDVTGGALLACAHFIPESSRRPRAPRPGHDRTHSNKSHKPRSSTMTVTQAPATTVPPDDNVRQLTVARSDDPELRHIAMVGDTYTILLSGQETADRFAIIDMLVPAGAGPPPHRHEFEEAFHVLEGELQVTVRGETTTVPTGATANVPANAPHAFRNASDQAVRLLCIVSPAGLEEFFADVGESVATRTTAAPPLEPEARVAQLQKGIELAERYRVDLMLPPA